MTTNVTYQITPATRMANVSYAIRDLAVVADQVASQGHQILYLNIGDPGKFDFPTPPHMIEAAERAMRDGFNGYGESLGERGAVKAIRAQAEANGFQNIQGIMVGYGSGEVIDNCLTALLNPARMCSRPARTTLSMERCWGSLAPSPISIFSTRQTAGSRIWKTLPRGSIRAPRRFC